MPCSLRPVAGITLLSRLSLIVGAMCTRLVLSLALCPTWMRLAASRRLSWLSAYLPLLVSNPLAVVRYVQWRYHRCTRHI